MWCTLESLRGGWCDCKRCCAVLPPWPCRCPFGTESDAVKSVCCGLLSVLQLQMLSWINFNNFFEVDPGSNECLKQKRFAHIIQGLKWSMLG